MSFWRELISDKTDPEGRPSKGGFRQMVAFFLGIALALVLFVLMASNAFPKEHAGNALILILALLGIHEVASINQKIQDTRIKTQALQNATQTMQETTSTIKPIQAQSKLPDPPTRQPRKGI